MRGDRGGAAERAGSDVAGDAAGSVTGADAATVEATLPARWASRGHPHFGQAAALSEML
jgi:hypothetical protein